MDTPRPATKFRELYGRQVNALNERYKLPADSKEMQHRSQTIAMGGLYPESYAEVMRQQLRSQNRGAVQIADFGSGSGDWISEMAREFPHAQAIGIDLAPSSPVDVPSNVRQAPTDINQDMSEYYGKLDMIQVRSVITGIADYPTFLEIVWRCLKPGGILMLLDGFVPLYDEDFNPSMSTAFAKLCSKVTSKMQFPNGTGADFSDQISSWLHEHGGFGNIQVENLYIPTGWNGSGKYCKNSELAGSIMVENMKKLLSAWRLLLLSAGVLETEVDLWIAGVEKELGTPGMLKAYVRWIITCAQKPA
ncbi:hypothetical protein FS749_009403 [Ceratobasidium sp. UAMH 11750]|nr:hypothetical protein FS749_009403 [Ceratobasidium sp. UAMH 11750]